MTASSAQSRRAVGDICSGLGIDPPPSSDTDDWYSKCPMCSHLRKTAGHQNSKVLHLHGDADGVRGFCNHCGWTFGEFFERRRHSVITATHDYCDERGELLFQVVRFHPKDFRQRRPDGHGGWIWNMQGVQRVLFRLPELIAAKANGNKVAWITEGERDAECLIRHGAVIATCNAGGAGKWRNEYSESLRGFEYALIAADKDAPGRRHAETVARSLLGIIPHVRVIEVPGDGKDVSDFFAAGGTLEELATLARNTRDWTPSEHPSAPEHQAEDWPEPDLTVLQLHRRPPPPLPLEVFGDQWAQWLTANAHASACPVDYVASALLSAASALIGHARWPQATRTWAEPPHLWACNVGYSGDGKSPGADPMFRHVLPEMQRRMAKDFPEQLLLARANIETAKAKMEAWKEEVKAAAKSGNAPALPPVIVEPDEPLEPRLVLNDVTIERIALLLAGASPKGLLMARDEIAGWLIGMNQYNDAARAFWLEAYGGRPYSVDRVKHPKPIRIPRLAVAWHGGIQPSRLVEVMREADDGLLARFMWFWPDVVLFDLQDDAVDIGWAITAFERLRLLDLRRDAGDAVPIMVPLSVGARRRMVKFGRLMQDYGQGTGGLMRSAVGKARGLALRISLVLAYLRWCGRDGYDAPPAEISEDDFLAAAKFVAESAMPMAERVFGDAERTRADLDALTLAQWIRKARPTEIHVRTLQRDVRLPGLIKAERIHAACEVLVDAEWLRKPPSATAFQERRREAYPVNPRLKEASV
jgi:hypothetical protein